MSDPISDDRYTRWVEQQRAQALEALEEALLMIEPRNAREYERFKALLHVHRKIEEEVFFRP